MPKTVTHPAAVEWRGRKRSVSKISQEGLLPATSVRIRSKAISKPIGTEIAAAPPHSCTVFASTRRSGASAVSQ
ncbi:MAG: hypothetical protein K8R36_23055 [Planctomycetales bacterium]|nr:hypothetical protein [Planctomycetales bacterium]